MPDPTKPTPEQNPPQPLTDPTVPPMRDPPSAPYRDPTTPQPNDPPNKPLHDPGPPPYSDPPGPVTGDAEWRPGADPMPTQNIELVRATQRAGDLFLHAPSDFRRDHSHQAARSARPSR